MKGRIVFHFVIMDTLTEFYHVLIDAASHFFCGRQSDDLQRSHKIMNGDIEEIIDACIAADQAAKLAKMNEES